MVFQKDGLLLGPIFSRIPLSLKFVTALFVLILYSSTIVAQHEIASKNADSVSSIIIQGAVSDSTGLPLKGVDISIINKDSIATFYTTSDHSGLFVLQVKDFRGNNSIIFRYPGYNVYRIKLKSVKLSKPLNITLQDKNDLDEVVVTTALGIKRENRSLGYAATVVSGDQLTDARSGNWTDALSGKVAGLNMVRSNAGPDGSNKIILRGENNLTGDNEALLVVDGVVINQGSGRRTSISGESSYGTGGENVNADYGSNLSDINPDDIESVTVLKGPGAAALYGQRGANGAIIITTKSGQKNKRCLGITVNSNASFESVNRWPDRQYEFGQGEDDADYYSYGKSIDGASTKSTSQAFGPKFDGQYFYQYDPTTQSQGTTKTLWKPYKDQINEFFNTGLTESNAVSLSGGSDKTTARFSISNVHNTWIIPNTGYNRSSIALSVNSKINDRLSILAKVNYNNKQSDNLPSSGYGNQSIMYWYIFWEPNADLNWLKDYWSIGNDKRDINRIFASTPANPYAVVNEYLNGIDRNAITGNIQGIYKITSSLDLKVRTSIDMSYDARSQKRPYTASSAFPKGSYRTQNIFSIEKSTDFLLSYSKTIPNYFFSGSVGGSILRNEYRKDEVRADSLIFPGLYSFANAAGELVTNPYRSKYAINSFYGMLNGSYKKLFYWDLSGRVDWNSVLATPTRTSGVGFFYPSANVSVIASDIFKLPEFIDYAKLRFSVSGVGSGETTPYLTTDDYITAGAGYGGALQNPSQLANPELKPLKTTTTELGAVVQLLKNRISLDVAVYSGATKNQILTRTLDRSSGFNSMIVNAGKVSNKGIEISLNTKPVSTKAFNWNVTTNFSANTNKVEDLPDSMIVLRSGAAGGIQIVAKKGGKMGDIYGRGFERSPDGQIVFDATSGYPLTTSDVKYLGNATPKGRVSIDNNFQFKQFSFGFLFDAQYGAKAYSLSYQKMSIQGKLTNSLLGRYNGIIGNGVIQNSDGSYSKNTITATHIQDYYRSLYSADNAESSTFSTDFIKLREVRFGFNFPQKIAKKIGARLLSLSFYGRDLFIWSPWPVFDPEFGTLSGSDIVTGIEYGQFPSTRKLGINLRINF